MFKPSKQNQPPDNLFPNSFVTPVRGCGLHVSASCCWPVLAAAGEDIEEESEVSDQPNGDTTEHKHCFHIPRRVEQLNKQVFNKCGIQNHDKNALNLGPET